MRTCWIILVMSNSLWSYGMWPARLICPWDSPGKNTGIFAMPSFRGSSPPRAWTCVSWQAGSLPLALHGEPKLIAYSTIHDVLQDSQYISTYIISFHSLNDSWISHFSSSVVLDSLQPHGLQHVRFPCTSLTLRTCSNSCPSSQWCHLLNDDWYYNPHWWGQSECWHD